MNSIRHLLRATLGTIAAKTTALKDGERVIDTANLKSKELIASLSHTQITDAVSEILSETQTREVEIKLLREELSVIQASCSHKATTGNQYTLTCSACGEFLGEGVPTSLIYDR